MSYLFNAAARRRIYDVNRVAYHIPAPHPSRVLSRHDLFYITSGSFSIALDNQIIHAGRDHVVILPADIYHEGIDNCEPDTHTLWILMEKEEADAREERNGPVHNQDILSLPFCIDVSGRPEIRKLFEKILLAHIDGNANRESAYMTLLLYELFDASERKEPGLILAEEIRHMISLALNENLSNVQIAQKMGKSVKTVENAFKKHYGVTIHQYILAERLKKGRAYLENFPDMPIRDIAAEMNFYDEYHFSRQFKKEYGVSPKEYKKKFFSTDRFNYAHEQ